MPLFSCGHATLRGFVRPSIGPSVMIELESVKTHISAPAHLSETGGRVSGLVLHEQVIIALLLLLTSTQLR